MDEYIRQQHKQNLGGICDHCGSAMGHFNVCPLINRGRAEVHSTFTWNGTATPLAPYQHELYGSGTACAEDCPACQWVDERDNKTKDPDVTELERLYKLEDNRG
jgi:hypothetical protein